MKTGKSSETEEKSDQSEEVKNFPKDVPLLEKSWLEESVNLNSNSLGLQKLSEKQKQVKEFEPKMPAKQAVTPLKAEAVVQPVTQKVAMVRPMMKIAPARRIVPENVQNRLDDDSDDTDVKKEDTCVKSVVPSDNTEVKTVDGSENNQNNDGYDSDETLVKPVFTPVGRPAQTEQKSLEDSEDLSCNGTDVDRVFYRNKLDSPTSLESDSIEPLRSLTIPVILGEDPLSVPTDRAGMSITFFCCINGMCVQKFKRNHSYD